MSRRPHHAVRVTAGVAVLGALWLLGLHVGGLDTGLLFLAPAFVLLLPLLAGRYVGEGALAPFVEPVRRAAAAALHRPRPRARRVPRGGLLVGCSLAGRAPPVV
jgi:hypothetical protein